MKKLKALIRSKYPQQAKLAEEMGLNPATLSLKLNGKSDFFVGEIKKMCKLLGIERSAIPYYFFPKNEDAYEVEVLKDGEIFDVVLDEDWYEIYAHPETDLVDFLPSETVGAIIEEARDELKRID